MAPSSSSALLLAVVFALLAASAMARPGVAFHPCNTIFISYTFSSSSSSSSGDGDGDGVVLRRPATSITIYRVLTPFRTLRPLRPSAFASLPAEPVEIRRPHRVASAAAAEFGVSSLKDRAKDILVVVVGLLFGVGCGALTAATMYLAWSVVTNRYEICGSEGYDEEEDDYALENPKKAGYVKIPAADLAPAKEGYEKN
ncbi:uncharacterized protein LOC109714516 [Ananas comosus]|uniref:Uncharacterized protein LOC109714516 n=1 Tax=Ananas comosus TaxID=4615 RepID=A0A6P5FNV8_ANACO|nr:uncharacterized protein LOC109714516 [Ananas comosus]